MSPFHHQLKVYSFNMDPINLLIVEDHQIVRTGLRAMLLGNTQIKLIGEASNANAFFELLQKQIPDVLILDIKLGGSTNGIEIAQRVKKSHPKVKSLMLTANTHEKYIIAALKAGAKGFLSKDCQKDEFIEAIEAVNRNKLYFGKDISEKVIQSYVLNIRGESEHSGLSTREFEIAKLLAEGLSAKQIGETLCISSRTVESHKSNILEKLGLNSTIDLVKYAIKQEWIEL